MAAAFGSVAAPQWALFYKGVNITAHIESMVTSVRYTSHVGGKAPDMEFTVEDRLKKWQGPWFPSKGDIVALQIGYAGEDLVSCGEFQVDEPELKGPPDEMTIRCVAAFITPSMRTQNTVAWEGQTLPQIAAAIAGKYGLSLVDAPVALNVTFGRITQRQETDLGFLKRIANAHGYDFTVRGTQLVFYAHAALQARPAVVTIERGGMLNPTRFSFKSKAAQIYNSAQVSWQDPVSKSLITATAMAASPVPNGDVLKISERCENGQQAALKAQAALDEANKLQITMTMTVPGSTALASGSNVMSWGWGEYDGKYLLETATHTLNREGYDTEIDGRYLGAS